MSTLPIPLPCSWSGHILTLRGLFALVCGMWVNPRHGRGPRASVAALANRGTGENYIGEEIMISHGDTVSQGSIRHRKHDVEVNKIGISNSNPIIDTRYYEVEFEDGSMSTYSENIIAESM